MDQKSIAEEELEYECLRTLCDTAMTYRMLAENSGMGLPRIDRAIAFLENMVSWVSGEFDDTEIVF